MLGANPFSMEAGGVGGYVWINNSIYAEFSAYGNLSPRLITDLNGGFDPTAQRFVGTMPYWRFAYEKTWDKNSLMFGTIGEYADQQPGVAATATDGATPLFFAGKTDPTLDLGVDTQYQFIGERDIITLHAAYIWENKKNNAEIAGMTGSGLTLPNQSDQLNDFMVSASYTYDRTYQLQVGWFDTWGTRDAGLYGSATNPGGEWCDWYEPQWFAKLHLLESRPSLFPVHERRRPRCVALVQRQNRGAVYPLRQVGWVNVQH